MNNRIRSYTTAMIAVFLLLWPGRVASALTFAITEGPGLSSLAGTSLHAQIRSGIEAATGTWSTLLDSDATINLYLDWANLGTPIAQASTTYTSVSYAAYRNALLTAADPDSLTDAAATASLPTNAPVYAMRNAGITVAGQNVRLSTALSKALGFRSSPLLFDGTLTLNSRYSYDFDSADGIQSGRYDFAGIVLHEVGHILGFTSAVDTVDGMSSGVVTPHAMDLWRYSQDGRDLSTGGTAYFSPDGDPTDMMLSTGVRTGDRNQASHWKSGTGGLMRPEVAMGQAFGIAVKDLMAMDAMGWNLRTGRVTATEPGSLLLLAMCVMAAIVTRKILRPPDESGESPEERPAPSRSR